MSDCRVFSEGPLADPEERRVVFAALDSFRQYRRNTHYNVTHRRRQNFYALPQRQREILVGPPFNLLDTLNEVDDALDCNADLAEAILELALQSFALPASPEPGSPCDWHGTAKPGDHIKAHSTIRQIYRDWSKVGYAAEVEPLFNIVLDDLGGLKYSPIGPTQLPTLLIPGAGLGRLLFSLSLHGYNVEGNEISYHQLLASNFILNAISQAEEYQLYPFVSTFTNHKQRSDQLKAVLIPDIHPATTMALKKKNTPLGIVAVGEMNMTAGDFLTSYNDPASQSTFDAIVSVYFIDTAPNLIRYIETVRNCLKDGGLWINIGPLLWHFDDLTVGKDEPDENSDRAAMDTDADVQLSEQTLTSDTGIGEPGSFELADAEVLALLMAMRFEVFKHDYLPTDHGGYIQDPASMVQNRYECSHWVARKLPDVEDTDR